MANITYLIGAGASANALPVVSDMMNRMRIFLNYISNTRTNEVIFGGMEKSKLQAINNQFESVLNEALIHATPDTFAKKLWLKEEIVELQTLKFFLSLYFLFEQAKIILDEGIGLFNGLPKSLENAEMKKLSKKIFIQKDSRYDVFFATLLDKVNSKLVLPSTVNVISWNYDHQFELAYNGFDDPKKKEVIQNLNIVPFTKPENDRGSIIKLNGMAGIYSNDDFKSFSELDLLGYVPKLINGQIKEFLEGNIKSYLNFAWELDSNPVALEAFNAAKEVMKNTDVLVIIGYSFPNFNKKIDRALLESCKKLKQVYYQAPESEIKALCKNFKWLIEDNLEPEEITDLNQFFIPPEFVFPEKGLQKSIYEKTELWKK